MKKINLPKALLMGIIVAIIGSAISLLVAVMSDNTIDTFEKNQPYISLGDNVKNKTTKAHLWFEELMAGDNGIDFHKDVLNMMSNSEQILNMAIKSGDDEELGHFDVCDDKELMKIIEKAIADLDHLITITNQRYSNKQKQDNKIAILKSIQQKTDSTGLSIQDQNAVESTGEEAGGDLDQEFDAAYEEVQTDMDKMDEHVDFVVATASASAKTNNRMLILSIVLLSLCVSYFMYKFQTRADKLAQESNNRMEHENIRLERLNAFVQQISSGDFSNNLDTGIKDDALANALNEMKEKLKTNINEEEKRNWTNVGLAKLGEILRDDNNDTVAFYDNIISFTVKYLNANQGGLFLLNTDNEKDKFLELSACFAYNKKKFVEKRIEIGEGLVGQCYLEKEIIFLTDIPDKYTTITSGLGEATPGCILLTPLIINEDINGILEIASFVPFEPHQIDFIKRLAESIASVIVSVRTSERTTRLLAQTQIQSEEMKAQEEELRQNLEELQATQEEFLRKERNYVDEIAKLKNKG